MKADAVADATVAVVAAVTTNAATVAVVKVDTATNKGAVADKHQAWITRILRFLPSNWTALPCSPCFFSNYSAM